MEGLYLATSIAATHPNDELTERIGEQKVVLDQIMFILQVYAHDPYLKELSTHFEEIKAAGLQGRGGAGFPAHFKWTSVRQQVDQERYVVCNADEAEPGTFKDRETILRQSHKMLEGLAIAATVVETNQIYIYIRGEFVNEYRVLEKAIAEAERQEKVDEDHFGDKETLKEIQALQA